MTDTEYKKEKARIKKVIDKFFKPLGFGWWVVDIEWDRERNEDSPSQTARTASNWQYRTARITFVVPVCAEQTDEELENIILHELSHILAAPIQDFRDDQSREITEYTVTNIAHALAYAYKAGSGEKPKG